MELHGYKKLVVWSKAVDFTIRIYELTASFPENEKFGLISQLRRAAVSVASNIAEGSKRSSRREFRNYVLMSFGSGAEIETQLTIAERLNFGERTALCQAKTDLEEIMRMLNALQDSLKQPTND